MFVSFTLKTVLKELSCILLHVGKRSPSTSGADADSWRRTEKMDRRMDEWTTVLLNDGQQLFLFRLHDGVYTRWSSSLCLFQLWSCDHHWLMRQRFVMKQKGKSVHHFQIQFINALVAKSALNLNFSTFVCRFSSFNWLQTYRSTVTNLTDFFQAFIYDTCTIERHIQGNISSHINRYWFQPIRWKISQFWSVSSSSVPAGLLWMSVR